MKTIKLFAAQENTEKIEGRGPMRTVVHTTSKEVALQIVNDPRFYKKRGVMGTAPYQKGKYDVKEEIINIVDTAEEFFNLDEQDEKETALNKLTERERNLLGL